MQRVVVIGARRRRQGIGEFVTRFLARAGARVCGVVGSSRQSAELACRALADEPGLAGLTAHDNVEEALARERPDITVICSPYPLHAAHLRLAAAAGTHCLCEKPMWWNEPPGGTSREAETAELVDAFIDAGRHVELVTPWPCTLPDFYRLYPHERDRPVRSLDMLLGPVSSGHEMALDAAPHPLSILLSQYGHGVVDRARATFRDETLRELDLDFLFRHGAASADETAVHCRFVTTEKAPRPAAYAVNGKRVRRDIALPGYTINLVAPDLLEPGSVEPEDERRIAIQDPLDVLVTGFLRRVQSGVATDRQVLIESVTGLEKLVIAARKAEENV